MLNENLLSSSHTVPFASAFNTGLGLCRRSAQHFVNNLWAKASTTPFYGVKVGSV